MRRCRSCRLARRDQMGASLRVRLVAALLGLVVALAGLGAWSAWHLWEMGEVAQRILADNYRSVEAAQQMREALERIDGDRRAALAEGALAAAVDLAGHRTRFDAALAVAAGNLTEPGEGAIVEQIRYRLRPLSCRPDRWRAGSTARSHGSTARGQPGGDASQERRGGRRGPAKRRLGYRARAGAHSGRHRHDDGDRQPRRPADSRP